MVSNWWYKPAEFGMKGMDRSRQNPGAKKGKRCMKVRNECQKSAIQTRSLLLYNEKQWS